MSEFLVHVSKRLSLFAFCLASLLVLAGCGADGAMKAPAAFDVFIGDAPTLPELPLGEAPLWGSDQVPIKDVNSVEFIGSTAILAGTGDSPAGDGGDGYVAAVDAGTGAMKWAIETLTELPGGNGDAVLASTSMYVSGPADNQVVLVDYRESDRYKYGVAALSPQDGSVLWMFAGVPAEGGSDEVRGDLDDFITTLTAASDQVALVSVGPPDAILGNRYAPPEDIRVLALNPADGTTLWEASGVLPKTIDGGVVVADTAIIGPEGEAVKAPGTVVALDASTGAQMWSAAQDHPQAKVVRASSGAVVVSDIDSGGYSLIRMSDGSDITYLGKSELCVTESSDVMACVMDTDPGSGYEMRLMTYEPGDDTVKISKQPISETSITVAWDGYVFYGVDSAKNEYGAVDKFGNVVSAQLPGRAVTINDKYAVFDTSETPNADPGSFAVYALSP